MTTSVFERPSVRATTVGDDPDPRLLQLGFCLCLALAAALAVSGGNEFGENPLAAAGLVLAASALLATPLVPWERTPRAWMGVLPAVDILALGLARLNQNTEGAGAAIILMVVPTLWLGWLFGRRGAVVATVLVILFAVLPSFAFFGVTRDSLSRAFFVTLVSGAAALVIALSLENAKAEKRRAEERGVELVEALATIEFQRRMAAAILDSVDVGLVLLDAEGNYQQANRRHAELLGIAFPTGLRLRAGQTGEVYGPDGSARLEGAELPTVRAMLGNEFDDMRIWIGSDQLTRRAISVSARRVLDERGRFAGAALAYKDVTDYMNLLRVKDEFLASVSHELRTPLTSIMGYLDLLIERDDLDEEMAHQLDVISRNSNRLLRLVADLLHTAQIDEGPMQVVRTPSDVVEIARESVGAAAPHAQGQGIAVDLEAPPELYAMVDARRIGQVFDNLISNAIKYTPEGGKVRVSVSLDVNRVEIAVADSGIGIEAADRDRLFTRFFRAPAAEASSIQGVGLGLSVLKSIVDSHGGRVEVESELGVGSVFRVRLPIDLPAGV